MNAELSRRGLLQVGAAVGGGLLVRMLLPEAHAAGEAAATVFKPNAFLRIDRERTVFIVNEAEMGQGITTSLPQILCEELELDPAKLTLEFAPASHTYDNAFGMQITGGSASVRTSYQPLREAGATARDMLRAAAAKRWNAPLASVTARDGHILSGTQSIAFGELADEAAQLSVPAVELKSPKDFTRVGRSIPRLDIPKKVDGTLQFGMDVQLPGLKTAVVVRCPVFGGKVKAFDGAAAQALPGVEDILSLGHGVAVVGTTYWHARQAAERLEITWDEGAVSQISTDSVRERFRGLIAAGGGRVARNDGDALSALAHASQTFTAEYEAPYLAHAPMEPMNCTALVTSRACDVWTGTQSPTISKVAAARASGLPIDRVHIHNTYMGGGFGRRAGADYVAEAVAIARATKKPIKVVYSREDDTQHSMYRPCSVHRIRGGIDADGRILGWCHQIASPSILAQLAPSMLQATVPYGMPEMMKGVASRAIFQLAIAGKDTTTTEGSSTTDYELPNIRVEAYEEDPGVPLGFWRSVGHSFNAFVVETFLDELAHAAGKDPLEVRRALLKMHHRNRWVLEGVAERAGWHTPPPAGVFRGIAQNKSFESFSAAVAEVSVDKDQIRVHRIVVGIDCGRVINPDIVAGQLESAAIFGLSAALKLQITLDRGRVVQSNFHDYDVVRMFDAPKVDVWIAQNEAAPTGVGEPGVPVIAPAVANAIFAATGKRLRRLPLSLA
jgi:isoquinoline 1-oxidoreductase beta subunit